MKKIKKILFPTDFSAMSVMAYKYCLNIACQLGASIDLLHIYSIDLGVPLTYAVANQMIEERKRSTNLNLEAFAFFKKAGDKTLIEGIKINTYAAVGLPEDEISNYSKNNDIDLVIMPTKGEHNVIEALFGSVTTAIIAKAECPVLVIPENTTYEAIKNIVYATDLSLENIDHVIMPIGLAKIYDAALHYVHIYDCDKAKDWDVEELLAANNEGVTITFHDLKGDTVQDGMQRFLKQQKVDLLMTYSPPKNFFERLFRLSTTRYMVENITTPLLVMR